jgi:hypothetical protein
MELVVLLSALIALAVLAPRIGKDTRDRLISPEEKVARLGFRGWVER